jgi:hypothetical protein
MPPGTDKEGSARRLQLTSCDLAGFDEIIDEVDEIRHHLMSLF